MSDDDKTIMMQRGAAPGNAAAALRITYQLAGGERKTGTFNHAVRIGRDPDSTVCLPHALVSRQHAELYPHGTGWRVKDLGSSNGTYLNGLRIEDAELPPQAVLQFGAEGPQIGVSRGTGAVAEMSPPTAGKNSTGQAAAQQKTSLPETGNPPITVSIEVPDGRKFTRQFRTAVAIGRDEHCPIRLNDEAVSRVHAELFHDGSAWCIRDLGSSNGTLLNGEIIAHARLHDTSVIQFGHDGPQIQVQTEPPQAVTTEQGSNKSGSSKPLKSIDEVARHYFDDTPDHEAGDHTMMVRRAFQQVKKKQSRRYYGIIGVVGLFLVASVGIGIYQHLKLQKAHEVAVEIFYNMKTIGIQVAKIEKLVRDTGETAYLGEMQSKRNQMVEMEQQYDRFLEEFGIMDKEMSEEDRIIMRMARLFGECELIMPEGFKKEVKRYIAKWRSSGRLQKALARLQKNDYLPVIYQAMVENHMPPQFMYLALQESNFNRRAVGPKTRFGIAKGMWQFIPSTAREYGMRTGPLVELPRFDPKDERFNVYKATNAAARFIGNIYNTDAQASGLLVMASYNWGPANIKKRIRQMPENPRERNFWKLLEQYKIPKETYDYVFYIFSASVIGENPGLFGFDFDNPLSGVEVAG